MVQSHAVPLADTPAAASTDEGLVRVLGVKSATLFVLGSVIGSGIFLTTGSMAAALPSATLLLTAWTLGGVIALTGGLSYAELGSMFPQSGGVYVYLREAFGPLVAFLYGWAAFLVFWSGGLAAVAVGFAEYLSYFFPALSSSRIIFSAHTVAGTWTVSAASVVAVAALVALAAINYIGVRSGNFVNIALTIAKVAGLAALPLLALFFAKTSPAWTPIVPAVPRPAAAFGVAMIAVLWTNDAWYCVTWIAGEMKHPQRDLPRALFLGIGLLTLIYLLANLAYLYTLPMDQLAGTTRVAERSMTVMIGPAGASIIALTVILSTFGADTAAMLAGARLLFAMARDGVFFKAAARIHPRYRTPHIAIVALAVWSSALALSGSYEQLFTYVAFASILLHMLGAIGLFRLRRTRPDAPRPYRVWGYPFVPAIFIAASAAFILNTLIERPRESFAGLGLLALGLPVYWYARRPTRS
jgi:APA family basic amino acid/polyamine antiporter